MCSFVLAACLDSLNVILSPRRPSRCAAASWRACARDGSRAWETFDEAMICLREVPRGCPGLVPLSTRPGQLMELVSSSRCLLRDDCACQY